MRSFNRVMLMGHLAADPELKQTQSGHELASFAVATNRFTASGEEDVKEVADFHRIVAWNGLAKVCNQHLAKGSAVFVEGRLINRSFDDKEGERHYKTEIVADNLYILTWKKGKTGIENISVQPIEDGVAK